MNGTSASPLRARLKRSARQMKSTLHRMRLALFSWRTCISVISIIIIAVLFSITITPARYNISVGMVPTHTITATRDVVDEVTTESLRASAAQAVQPTYVTVDGVADTVLANLNQIFLQMDAAIQYSEKLEDYGPTRRYTAEELEYARKILTLLPLRDYQLRTLLNTTREDLSTLFSILSDAIQNTMSSYIIQGSEYVAVSNIMQIVGYRVDTSLMQNVVQPLLNEIIQPNIVIDQEATEAAREAARAEVEPVIYKQGQNIVVKGEGRVERYQYEMLSAMGLLSNNTVSITIYVGAVLLVVLTVSLALCLLRFLRKDIIYDIKRLVLLFIIVILTLVCCIFAQMLNIYLAPIALSALLLSSMLGLEPAVIFNVVMSVLVSAMVTSSRTSDAGEMMKLLACSLGSGTVGAMLAYNHTGRLRVILAALAVGACNLLYMISLGYMTGSNMDTVQLNALWGLASGGISGALCIAIQPLLELIFNLPTPTKLMELSNPNHPLLHRLLLEAPGTYHHSIVVSSLAEAAAEAIGANPLLARVGGYYHDVGKLRRPQFFKENQLGGENLLVENDPYTAAQIVISHTRDGVTLAKQYHLPQEVIRIIQEHHGNTPVMYFYSMALKQADGKPVDVANFRYDANPPSTKEGAIVLLCDTIEAAVRSMPNPTPEGIEQFIVKLVRGKLQDGQLSNSPLTLKDIDDICRSCTMVLNGVFHERIEYPDPPAELQKSQKHPSEKAAPVPVPDERLTKPWDGFTEESNPITVDDSGLEEAAQSSARGSLEDIPDFSQPIPVRLSDFEPDTPLPEVEVPQPEAVPSVEELMQQAADEGEKEDPV